MDCKRKATKYGYQLVDKSSEGTQSSAGENTRSDVIHSPRSPKEAKYSVTSKDIFYIDDNFDIEVVVNTQVANDREGNKLVGVMVVPSLV